MRLDFVSIFPEWFAPLTLSLAGKAREKGLIDVGVHDLRRWTDDKHRTVDDTPYGGGAGMVMKPEPWGAALDDVLTEGATLVVPTPSGEPFTQRVAAELAASPHLVFACGRYEGIDQRVVEEVSTRAEVREVSLGDYVLNGGEVAALAVTEAVVRLIPGFMGNAESLVEESHAGTDRLLEYPVYTKPAVWRGRPVPDVLLSGDHARIAAWRRGEALRRTAERRPDLLHASTLAGIAGEWEIVRATRADAPELHVLTLGCWVGEALLNDDLSIPTLHETLASTTESVETWHTYVVRLAGRLVGSVRGRRDRDDTQVWEIGRLMVAPDLRGRGLGRVLLDHAEQVAPDDVRGFRLVTGKHSEANLRRYKRAGYRITEVRDDGPSGPVVLAKRRR
ncbi:MAG: tRNA (guanosine(37)-N1)-methyltransferase TrmD [Nocardioides sp.]|nr:tRNA (guanosine(37)-N1)-methyltransferase TrmD [Nocardioides sp.]